MSTTLPPPTGAPVSGLPRPRLPVQASALAAADDEAARRRDLRRMKRLATGLFLLAAAVFVVARLLEDEAGWVPYLRATAEAAMVGALADWFAVTALFRHPLGIPIPHTAIIPSNKDRIGRALGRFIQHNFLAPDAVAQRVADAQVARRVGEWLVQPANADRAASSLAVVIAGVADVMDEDEAAAAIEQVLVARVRATPAAPVVATLLETGIEGGHHHALVDSFLRAAGSYLDEHREVLRDRIRTESPWWVPEPVDERVFEKVFRGAKRFVDDLAGQPDHPLRLSLDRRLQELVERLRTDPEMQALWEGRKEELLSHPSVQAWARSAWGDVRDWLSSTARDPSSPLRERLVVAVAKVGAKLHDDPQLQGTVDRWAVEAATTLSEQYGDGVADFIASTVSNWEAGDTSDRLELQVGRDLQYIRINGTIVGGLAGLVIFTLGRLL